MTLPSPSTSGIASIALFRTVLLSFVRVYWRPTLAAGSQPVPSGPCFLYGNHSNRWDPFVLNCFTPWARPTAGVMTREFFRKRFLSWALRSIDIHPTRKRIVEPGLVRSIRDLLARDKAIVIYPEGGSRWCGRPDPWIESTAKIFSRFGFPVHPIVMHGSYVAWPRWATYPRPARMEIEILPAVRFHPDDSLEDVLARLQKPIAVDENVIEERLRPRWAFRPADGIHRLLYRDPVTGHYGGLVTADGTFVTNQARSLRWKMLPDSRLQDPSTGQIHNTGEIYDAIRQIPLTADSGGVYLEDDVEVSTEVSFPQLVNEGFHNARLMADAILLRGSAGDREIPLEKILSVDIERNFKLQLTLDDLMVQMAFTRGGSALAWSDALKTLGA